MITDNGVNSISFKNALAKAKRNAAKEKYSFVETIEDVATEYYLTTDEIEALTEKLIAYCKKNYLYRNESFWNEW